MLRQIWTLCRKELRLWMQRVNHWVVLFVLPMVFISVLGTAFSSGTPAVPIHAANPEMTPFQTYIPGFSLMFVFFLATNLAATVVDEREVGTLRRLLITPASRSAILLGKLLPYLLLAIEQLVVLFSVCGAVFDVDMGDAPLALGVVMVCAAVPVAGLGIMIAAVAKTKRQAVSVPTVVIIALAIVSGCIGPHITVPGIKYATPHYWALLGFQNVMVRGMGFAGVWLPCGILLAFAVVFLTIGAQRFKFE
jgi:ABC-2 type transport system permease protein